jgi:hypothetical protein
MNQHQPPGNQHEQTKNGDNSTQAAKEIFELDPPISSNPHKFGSLDSPKPLIQKIEEST